MKAHSWLIGVPGRDCSTLMLVGSSETYDSRNRTIHRSPRLPDAHSIASLSAAASAQVQA
jgi:hypothetical protein